MEKKKEIIWGSLKEYQIKDTSAEQFAKNDLSRIYRKNYSFFSPKWGKVINNARFSKHFIFSYHLNFVNRLTIP